MSDLKKLLSDIFEIKEDEIADEISMKTIENWDSLKHMELIVSIEEKFNIRLTADEIISMIDYKGIKNVLKNRGVEP